MSRLDKEIAIAIAKAKKRTAQLPNRPRESSGAGSEIIKSSLILLLAAATLAGVAGIVWLISGLVRCRGMVELARGWLTALLGERI